MKGLWSIIALVVIGQLQAQSYEEKFPVFAECSTVNLEDLEECFYDNLYKQLKDKYKHPVDSTVNGNSTVNLRFEVNQDGQFVPIRIDAVVSSHKEAMTSALSELPQIEPPKYNGEPTYMQFILRVTVPMSTTGKFQTFEAEKDSKKSYKKNRETGEERLDSIAFAKANQEYDLINSNGYNGQQLRSDGNIPLSYQRYHRYEAAMNKVGNNAHTAVKPYSFNYVDQYFDLEEERKSQLKEKSTWLGRKWHNEHFFEVAGRDYWFVLDPGVDLQLGRDGDEGITTFNNTRLVHVNGGIGRQITFGATIQESQARFPGYFAREVELRAPDGGTPGIVPR